MFYDNIKKICEEKGTAPTTILKELGYSTGNVTQWKKGSCPNIDIALDIARKLDISLDYLVTLEEAKHRKSVAEILISNPDTHDSCVMELQRLLMCYQLASRDDKNVVWAALNKYAGQIDKI